MLKKIWWWLLRNRFPKITDSGLRFDVPKEQSLKTLWIKPRELWTKALPLLGKTYWLEQADTATRVARTCVEVLTWDVGTATDAGEITQVPTVGFEGLDPCSNPVAWETLVFNGWLRGLEALPELPPTNYPDLSMEL